MTFGYLHDSLRHNGDDLGRERATITCTSDAEND